MEETYRTGKLLIPPFCHWCLRSTPKALPYFARGRRYCFCSSANLRRKKCWMKIFCLLSQYYNEEVISNGTLTSFMLLKWTFCQSPVGTNQFHCSRSANTTHSQAQDAILSQPGSFFPPQCCHRPTCPSSCHQALSFFTPVMDMAWCSALANALWPCSQHLSVLTTWLWLCLCCALPWECSPAPAASPHSPSACILCQISCWKIESWSVWWTCPSGPKY